MTNPDLIRFLPEPALNDVLCIVQFGSSLYNNNTRDVDIAIVIRRGKFIDFLRGDYFLNKPSTLDVSLIREEELVEPFEFGSHGVHLLAAFSRGVTLFGENVFTKLGTPTDTEIRISILNRLKDYLYEVRKIETQHQSEVASLEKRWGKYQRLCLFLVTNYYTFPEVLRITDEEVEQVLKEQSLDYSPTFTTINFEQLWEAVRVKNS